MSIRNRNAIPAFVSAAALFLTGSGFAWQGRNFAADFWVSGVEESATTVQVELALKIFNHGSAAVSNAEIRLVDRSPGGLVGEKEMIGRISEVTIPAHDFTVVHGQFTVPAGEFDQWRRGGIPQMALRFWDSASAREVSEVLDLRPQTQPVEAVRQ